MEAINGLLGTNIQPDFLPPRRGDVRHSQADISKARDLLGYRPEVAVTEGLARTVAWFSRREAVVGLAG